jgi:Short C-terminal domain
MVVAPRRMGRPGLMGTMARTAVVAGTATAVAGGVSRHNAQRADQQAQNDAGQQQAAAAAAPRAGQGEAATPSAADQLAQLSSLHQQGALTDDEFAAAKAHVLGS